MKKNNIIKVIETPLDDKVIKDYLPDALILTYDKLKNYNNIEELLPQKVDYFILLYLREKNNGHWVIVCRYDNIIEYNDSYGNKIDEPLNWITPEKNKELGIDRKFLSDLLFKQNKFYVISNNKDYQKESSQIDINTCGRYSVCRAINLIGQKGGLTLPQYTLKMEKLKKETNQPYDVIVSDIINKL